MPFLANWLSRLFICRCASGRRSDPDAVDYVGHALHVVVARVILQKHPTPSPDIDSTRVAFNRVWLPLESQFEASIRLAEGGLDIDCVVVASAGPPDYVPLEKESGRVNVTFDRMRLLVEPNSVLVSHDDGGDPL